MKISVDQSAPLSLHFAGALANEQTRAVCETVVTVSPRDTGGRGESGRRTDTIRIVVVTRPAAIVSFVFWFDFSAGAEAEAEAEAEIGNETPCPFFITTSFPRVSKVPNPSTRENALVSSRVTCLVSWACSWLIRLLSLASGLRLFTFLLLVCPCPASPSSPPPALTPIQVLDCLPEGQYPGSLLIKLGLGTLRDFSESAAEWQAEALKLRNRTSYLLRVHIYQVKHRRSRWGGVGVMATYRCI